MRYLLTFIFIILISLGVWMVSNPPTSDTGTDISTTTTTTTSNNSPATTSWTEYKNDRFGYEIAYPDYLSTQIGSQNNDGLVLTNEAEDITLRVFASNNTKNKSLRTIVGEETQRLTSITGANIGSSTATITGGVENNNRRQAKILFSEKSIAIVRVTYTNNQDEDYDKILTSFRWLPNTETNSN